MTIDKKYMSEEKQELVKLWLDQHHDISVDDIGLILLLAERFNEQPDAIRGRLRELRRQVNAIRYGIDYR